MLLKSKLYIPSLRIDLCDVQEQTLRSKTFYKSAIILGKGLDCDMSLENCTLDESIHIERRGHRYYLLKSGLAFKNHGDTQGKSEEFIELFSGDEIDLGRIKLKVKMLGLSMPLYLIIGFFILFIVLAIYGGRPKDIKTDKRHECIASGQTVPLEGTQFHENKEEDINVVNAGIIEVQTQKPPQAPSPDTKSVAPKALKENVPVSNDADLKETPSLRICSDNSYYRLCKKPPNIPQDRALECKRAHDFQEQLKKSKFDLIYARLKKSKNGMGKALKLLEESGCSSRTLWHKESSSLLSEMLSFECKNAFKSSDFISAKKLCSKSLGYSPNKEAKRIIAELDGLARDLFLEGYILESSDKRTAVARYMYAINISSENNTFRKKALVRVSALKGEDY